MTAGRRRHRRHVHRPDPGRRRDRRRSTVGKVLTTPDDPSQAVETVLAETLARADAAPADGRARHPRHDAGHQRDHRAQGRATALLTTRGLPRRVRDRPRASLRPVRPVPGDADAAGAAPPALRGRRADAAPTARSLQAPDEAYVERAGRASWRDKGIEAIAVCFLHSYANPRTSSWSRAMPCGELAPGHARLALVRGGARDPRVRAHLDHRRQRLRPGPGRALPARAGAAAARARASAASCS